MIYAILFFFFCVGDCATHAAEQNERPYDTDPSGSQNLLCHALRWAEDFGQYVAEDAGYKHFESALREARPSITHYPHFEELNVCEIFTKLRCATCFAMAISTTVTQEVFSSALNACQESEVFQVFVAADSYYKGRGNSQKFKMLRDLSPLTLFESPTELHHPGALFTQHPWLVKKIHAGQPDVSLQHFLWLREWEYSRQRLSGFLDEEITPSIQTAFQRLMIILKNHPYALHHLEISDLRQNAYALVPALLDRDNFRDFNDIIEGSLPHDPHKADIYQFCQAMPMVCCDNISHDARQTYYTILVQNIWMLFRSLNAYVTPEQWDQCITLLCHQHPGVNSALTDHHDWKSSIFAHQELDCKPAPAATSFDYYLQHHRPHIFRKHEEVINNICQILQPYCTLEQWRTCEKHQDSVYTATLSAEDGLHWRNQTLTILFVLRCSILYRLAHQKNPPRDIFYLYSTCSPTEKRALYLNTQQKARYNVPILQKNTFLEDTFLNVTLPPPFKDLNRISLSIFLIGLDLGYL